MENKFNFSASVSDIKKKILSNLKTNKVFLRTDKDYTYDSLYKFLNILENKLKKKEYDSIIVICDKSFKTYSSHIFSFLSSKAWVPISDKISKNDLTDILKSFKNPLILHNNFKKYKFFFKYTNFNLLNLNYEENTKNNYKIKINKIGSKAIFFTSGSSGKPKGVKLSLQNILVNIANIGGVLKLKKNDNFADFHEVSFVISIPILIFCFINGKTLTPGKLNDILNFELFIKVNKVNILITVPTLYKTLVRTIKKKCGLKYLITCGEPIDKNLIIDIKKKISYEKLFNFYGSTEVAPWILYCDLEKILKNDLFQDSYAPAGKPLKYVKLDFSKDKNTLLVNGPQVFDSYIGKNFLKNKKQHGYYIYDTGDIFSKSKNYYFCKGRIDHQFKRFGYRLNILSLEFNYKKILKTKILYVVFLEEKSKVCCITEKKIEQKAKEKLLKSLPKYKHPDFFLELDKFSSTSSGKISRTDLKEICKKNV